MDAFPIVVDDTFASNPQVGRKDLYGSDISAIEVPVEPEVLNNLHTIFELANVRQFGQLTARRVDFLLGDYAHECVEASLAHAAPPVMLPSLKGRG